VTVPGSAGRFDVVVAEDVWGPPFDALAGRRRVLRDAELWRDRDRLRAALDGARVLVVRNRTPVTADLLDSAAALLVVARAGVGLDNIDLDAARRRGVVVVSPRGANSVSVAEHTLALAFAVARSLVVGDAEVRAGRWNRRAGRELAGGVWGLVGAGATAVEVARRVRALDMTPIAHDPYADPVDPALVASGLGLASLDEVCARADVLSLHVPATDETRGMVDAAFLRRMKPAAILVNVGRGELVDEAALHDALVHGTLGGAGLDVRAEEPPAPGPLDRLENVVLTPHVAGLTLQSQARIAAALVDDIERLLDGGPARHAVGRDRPGRALVG
jgi:D-3-phosphoglycerate dehydrogenase/(S)-sulfolactate dehydrogenase